MRSLILILILIVSNNLFAITNDEDQLAVTADISLASKYMMDGFKVGGDKPVWQISGITDLYKSGFSVMFWTAMQVDRTNRQFDEQDLFLRYSHDFFKDDPYKLNFHGFYDYWIFPNSEPTRDGFGDTLSDSKKHGNKFQIGFSMPNSIPIGDSYLIPTYNIYYLRYWAIDRSDLFMGGYQHELMLEYSQAIPVFIPKANYQYAGASVSTNYNGGTFNIHPGISHSIAKLETGIYALNSIFTLEVFHQWTYKTEINPGNELWTTLSYVKKF